MSVLKLSIIEMKLSLRSFDAVFFGIIMPVIIVGIIYLVNKTILTENFGAYISIGICAIGLMALPLTLSGYREKGILKKDFRLPLLPPGNCY